MKRSLFLLTAALLLGATLFLINRPDHSGDSPAPDPFTSTDDRSTETGDGATSQSSASDSAAGGASSGREPPRRPDTPAADLSAEIKARTLPTLPDPIAKVVSKSDLIDRGKASAPGGKDRTIRRQLYRTPSKRMPLVLLEQEVGEDDRGVETVFSSHLFIGDQALVELPQDAKVETFQDWVEASPFHIRKRLPNSSIFVLGTRDESVDAIDTMIQSVRKRFGDGVTTDRDGVIFPSATPNDPDFGTLWGLEKIQAEQAWNLSTGSSSVVVGVIDSGVSLTHEDISDNLWTNNAEANGLPGVDDDDNGYIDDIHGYDFANDDGDPSPSDPANETHGTHVAGTVGAVGNNGKGVAGVNWNVSLISLKFLDFDPSFEGEFGSVTDAIEAVRYATANGADLTNNSWGGGGFNSILESAIEEANSAGILFVAAAGNAASNNDTSSEYPANFDIPNVIAVAATDQNDDLAEFSNFGASSVDLAAPGVDILSTVPGDEYEESSGTSMAAPQVAGALALLFASEPSLGAQDAKSRLLGSVDPVASLSGQVATGGRLNVRKLLGAPDEGTGSGSALELLSMVWTDDRAHSPNNNGNGVFEAGETIGITYTVRNTSPSTLLVMSSDIEAHPSIENNLPRGFDSMTSGNLALGNLSPGQTKTDSNLRLFCYQNTYVPFTGSFEITLRYMPADTRKWEEQTFSFTQAVGSGPNPQPEPEPVPAVPRLTLGDFELSDDPSISPHNNGDGIFSPGETIGLRYTIDNTSEATATIVRSFLAATPEEVDGVTIGLRTVTGANFELGPIAPGESKTDTNLRVFCYGNTPLPYEGSIDITVVFGDMAFDDTVSMTRTIEISQTKSGSPTNPDAFPSGEFANWLNEVYDGEEPPADAMERDRNGNGRADLLDFAFGPERDSQIRIESRTDTATVLSFPLRESIPLSAVRLEHSIDLKTWREAPLNTSDTAASSHTSADGSGGKRVRLTIGGEITASPFYRLRIKPAYTESASGL
ncbi:MAG: S8 family serine peptidase [Puniceicoccaceae bacterium]